MAALPSQIGPYSVERELGRGGMGVVYLARDTRLDRAVAIKSLPEELASDAARLERFEREARTLAQLSHPNIAGIHGVEEQDGARYLVLEYVEGETLADVLDRGALPVDEAVELAAQIAAGVEAAHEAGVIHRDLKPGNIIVTPDGQAKVLDFGLARTEEAGSSSGGLDSPTLTSPAMHSPTMPGVILGTAAYMSPEQARGRRVDKRTDVWSFGVVLYEMLVGASPFHGETVSDSIGAVLHKDLDLERLPRETPANVRRTLRRCLERDRNLRFRDIGDVRVELLSGSIDSGAPERAGRAGGVAFAVVALLALAVGVLGAGAAWRFMAPRSQGGVIIASIDPPRGARFIGFGDLAGPAAISPDGSRIVYAARDESGAQALWLRDLDSAEARRLPETDRATFPFWSPDSRSIAFFSGARMLRLDLTTGTVRTLCETRGGRGGAWLVDDTIVFSPSFQTGIFRIPASGGEPAPLTVVDETRHTSHRWPMPIAGSDRFIYIAVSHDPDRSESDAIYLASLDGSVNTKLISTPFGGQVVGDRLLFLRDGAIVAAPIDLESGAITGDPVAVVRGVEGDRSTWHGGFIASNTGALVHVGRDLTRESDTSISLIPGIGEVTGAMTITVDGRPSLTFVEDMLQNSMDISPDGLRVAISGRRPDDQSDSNFDIWVYQVFTEDTDWAADDGIVVSTDRAGRRVTFEAGSEVAPVWSPDGDRIAYGRLFASGGGGGLFVRRVAGGAERMLVPATSVDTSLHPSDWTRDGNWIICHRGSFVTAGEGDIVAVPADGGEPIDLVVEPREQGYGRVSPDGKWLAYTGTETGQRQVLVIPFAPGWERERAENLPVPPADARWRVSLSGGQMPRWGDLGKTLYYVSSSDSMIAVTWHEERGGFVHDSGRALFDYQFDESMEFDVFPNEMLFAVNTEVAETNGSTTQLVLNWPSLLAEK